MVDLNVFRSNQQPGNRYGPEPITPLTGRPLIRGPPTFSEESLPSYQSGGMGLTVNRGMGTESVASGDSRPTTPSLVVGPRYCSG